MLLADVNGNGLKDLVGFTQDASGFQISVVRTDWPFRKMVSFDSRFKSEWAGVNIGQIWTGRFLYKDREAICFRRQGNPAGSFQQQQIYCLSYGFYYPSGAQLTSVATSAYPFDNRVAREEFAVGDFDGNGYDES